MEPSRSSLRKNKRRNGEKRERKPNFNFKGDVLEIKRKMDIQRKILEILGEKELYWCKRAQSTWLLKGDNNSDFFHRVANGRKKNTPSCP